MAKTETTKVGRYTERRPLRPDHTKPKKFIAVFDGYRFSDSTLKYAIQLTRKADAWLEGLFLDDSLYHSYPISPDIKSYKNPDQNLMELDEQDQKKRDEAVERFRTICEQEEVPYTLNRSKNIAIHELKQESIFADLIIINSHETFNPLEEKSPTRFVRELLTDAQCPVMVVPDEFKPIDKITFLYDGAPSSVFAIKMFSYIFKDLLALPVEIFTVKEKARGSREPKNKLMREFIKWHFPQAKFIVTKGNPEEEIPGHLRTHNKNELVVLGAYRRSEISMWFKASMADILMKQLDMPLFIAHN